MPMVWRRWIALGCLSLAGVAGPLQADEEIRPYWLTYDTAKHVVQLLLIGAEDGTNGTMNFNGYGNGTMTVTVPLGWKVEVEFRNKGLGALPHSLVVINEVTPLPIEGGVPAFSRALTRALIPGLGAGETDTFDFVANKAGRFLLFCGTTGHGVIGMWDYLVVSQEAKVPGVTVKAKK
ncbi:MAG: sulfocyanin-like copper-binding protein [Candidatus Rokuibacteriota bacterium]